MLRPRTILVLFSLLGALTACSRLSLTYNFADWIVYWKIDKYFDVSSQQKPLLNSRLAHFHSWHRQKEIPHYVRFFRTLLYYWQDGLTPKELDEIFQNYRTLRNRLGTRFATESVIFLDTLTPSQIEYFEHVMRVNNQELLDEIESDPVVRKAKRVDSVIDWLEGWVGDLSPIQVRQITPLINQFPDTTDAWLMYRSHRQLQFLTLLKAHADSKSIERQVRHWLTMSDQGAPANYPTFAKNRDRKLKEIILAIDRVITSDQRTHANQRLQSLIQDLQNLVGGIGILKGLFPG